MNINQLLIILLTIITLSSHAQTQTFEWVRQWGGTVTDRSYGVTCDAFGNVFTTGDFEGTADFDPGTGTAHLTSAGATDAFISKMDTAGNFIWAKSIGGTDDVGGLSITTDALGNVITTGGFEGTADFDPNMGTFPLSSSGSIFDAFVSKLDASGNFIWARQFTGTNIVGFSVATDTAGNIVVTGRFSGTADFDPGAGTYTLTSAGSFDIFVAKLDAAGNFLWAHQFGSSNSDYGHAIATDDAGNVYTTGHFSGTADFDPGGNTFTLISAGTGDIFISKLDPSGNFVWAKRMGGNSSDVARSIAIDPTGSILTSGAFQGTADFDPGIGVYSLTSEGNFDVFVSKLDTAGDFMWARH